MKLFIDCRENAIVEHYHTNNNGNNNGNNNVIEQKDIEIKQLPTCDFIFMSTEQKPLICIERKTISDLASSITDGRYKTQKVEMAQYANSFEPLVPRLVYLIEGNIAEFNNNTSISSDIIMSCVTKILFRDGFQVIFTNDLKDTIKWIEKIWHNLCKGEFEKSSEEDQLCEYLAGKQRKTLGQTLGHIEKTNWWLMSLANIQGVSIKKAMVIIESYPTIKDLLSAYDKCENDTQRKKLLSVLKVNNRKLGDACSENIYKAILLPSPITNEKTKENNKEKTTIKYKQKIPDECLFE